MNPMPSDNQGHTVWMRWLHTLTAAQVGTAGGPANWGDQNFHDMPGWGYGFEALHCVYDGAWGYKDKETFDNVEVVFGAEGNLGGQMVYTVGSLENDRTEDYQLKVLYEYGNCQYNFSRSATPTRVLPNVVPVGPSPGIPSPL
jgi:hypothetical protein